MMAAGDGDAHAEERASGMGRLDRLQGLRPDPGMGLHDLEFIDGELSRLEEDPVRNAELADVVQGAGVEERLDKGVVDRFSGEVRPSERRGQPAAVDPDPSSKFQ